MPLALRLDRLRLRRLEEAEHGLDVRLGALVVEHAEAERETPVQARRGDEAGAAALERGRGSGVAGVVEVASPEADDAERRRGHQLERLAGLDPPRRSRRDEQRAADRLAEGRHAE